MRSVFLLLGLLGAFTLTLHAKEAEGMVFPETLTVAGRDLVLNGTATRSVFGFRVYVAGLYVSSATGDEVEIMERNPHPKRLRIIMLRVISQEKFASAVRDNVAKNFSAEERAKFASELEVFFKCFDRSTELAVGSEVKVDYLPDEGTIIEVEGRRLAAIPGHEFYHALLRLWIGEPLQASMKTGLLGGRH